MAKEFFKRLAVPMVLGSFSTESTQYGKQEITVVTSVDTAVEALSVSMGEKACVDLNYMSELYVKSTEDILFQNRSVFGFVYCKYIN